MGRLLETELATSQFGMLQCLDRPHRLFYILGETFELPGPPTAAALGISPELFRKRLQQASAGGTGRGPDLC